MQKSWPKHPALVTCKKTRKLPLPHFLSTGKYSRSVPTDTEHVHVRSHRQRLQIFSARFPVTRLDGTSQRRVSVQLTWRELEYYCSIFAHIWDVGTCFICSDPGPSRTPSLTNVLYSRSNIHNYRDHGLRRDSWMGPFSSRNDESILLLLWDAVP